jgi:hypothetical protein
MFTQTAFVVLAIGYSLRKTRWLNAIVFEPRLLDDYGVGSRVLLPALVLISIYLVEIILLWFVHGRIDNTALDWAIVVLLLGVLLTGPVVGSVATIVVLLLRAVLVFADGADPLTWHKPINYALLLVSPQFWLDEYWVWLEPGVLALLTSALLGGLAYWVWQKRLNRQYPLWLGLPLALGIQSTFIVAANQQWGRTSAIDYLRGEALPVAIGLALAVTVFVFVTRAIRAEHERRRAQRAELASTRHQLGFLNAQINPHFLYNTLSAVSGLILTSPEKAQSLLGELGGYFRAICEDTEPLVTLEGELSLVKSYVLIEKARLTDRLEVTFDIENNCLPVNIPRLTLQPLVENAIKHGVATRINGGSVYIKARIQDQRLTVLITDDGHGLMNNPTIDEYGVGLSNVYKRLLHFYSDSMIFSIDSIWGAGTSIRLEIPIA